MTKTFETDSEENTMNYQMLFATIVLINEDCDAAPPPISLLSLPFKALCLARYLGARLDGQQDAYHLSAGHAEAPETARWWHALPVFPDALRPREPTDEQRREQTLNAVGDLDPSMTKRWRDEYALLATDGTCRHSLIAHVTNYLRDHKGETELEERWKNKVRAPREKA